MPRLRRGSARNSSPYDAIGRRDVAIVGSGFAGALCALALRQRGRRVALIERGRHPRFAIGESTTPLTNLLLEELADRYDLPQIRSFSKWGTWQQRASGRRLRPQARVHVPLPSTRRAIRRRRAITRGSCSSPRARTTTSPTRTGTGPTSISRSSSEAAGRGRDLPGRDAARHDPRQRRGHARSRARASGRAVEITAGFVDRRERPARIPDQRARHRRARRSRWLPPTQGLYHALRGRRSLGETCRRRRQPPYPPDEAALHHVFPGGWIWVLRFNNGITSAGAALTDPLAARVRAVRGRSRRGIGCSQALPSVARSVPRRARHAAVRPRAARGLPLPRVAGDELGAAAVGRGRHRSAALDRVSADAARHRAAARRARDHVAGSRSARRRSPRTRARTQQELDVTEQLVAALYACMADPALFKRLSLLYFAAASYSETVRRLGRPHLAPGFLLNEHPHVRPGAARLCGARRRCAAGPGPRRALRAHRPRDRAVRHRRPPRSHAPRLVSGAGRRPRSSSAAKLEASAADVQRLLVRCGLVSC